MSIFCRSCRSTLIRIAFLSAFVSSRTVLWHNTCPPRGRGSGYFLVRRQRHYWLSHRQIQERGRWRDRAVDPARADWMAHRGSQPGTFAKVSILRGAGETGSDDLQTLWEQIAADL